MESWVRRGRWLGPGGTGLAGPSPKPPKPARLRQHEGQGSAAPPTRQVRRHLPGPELKELRRWEAAQRELHPVALGQGLGTEEAQKEAKGVPKQDEVGGRSAARLLSSIQEGKGRGSRRLDFSQVAGTSGPAPWGKWAELKGFLWKPAVRPTCRDLGLRGPSLPVWWGEVDSARGPQGRSVSREKGQGGAAAADGGVRARRESAIGWMVQRGLDFPGDCGGGASGRG